jgi:hypothetical protein
VSPPSAIRVLENGWPMPFLCSQSAFSSASKSAVQSEPDPGV